MPRNTRRWVREYERGGLASMRPRRDAAEYECIDQRCSGDGLTLQ